MQDIANNTYNHIAKNRAFDTYQKIQTVIFNNSQEASIAIANQICKLINAKAKEEKNCVLGLATGSTPLGVYQELKKRKEKGQSYKNVVTFNLDEYYPIKKNNPDSYYYFMKENLFKYLDIPDENIHIPNCDIDKNQINNQCKQYQQKIKKFGGIDLQLLGIGSSGHIGFNQPGSTIDSITRLIHLQRSTQRDNSINFSNNKDVPKYAITMGIMTVMQAKKIILLAFSQSKAKIAQKAIQQEITSRVPASFLQKHQNVKFYLDKPSAKELIRFKNPWIINFKQTKPEIFYDWFWSIRAIKWLCNKYKLPILRLTQVHYQENFLSQLLQQLGDGTAQDVNEKVFNSMNKKITTIPLGSQKKKILVFCPYPIVEICGMGGTLIHLISQQHEIHIVYLTSGNISVFNHDAIKFLRISLQLVKLTNQNLVQVFKKLLKELENEYNSDEKKDVESQISRNIKYLIRLEEGIQACTYLGIPKENIYSLRLPFYQFGKITKKKYTQQDIQKTKDIIKKIKPNYIFSAADLTDPHGTFRKCLEIVLKAIEKYKQQQKNENPEVLLSRGAWQQWDLEMMKWIVPLSPMIVQKKRYAIFRHQTQKDRPMFPGNEQTEFWQRIQYRNRRTADQLQKLGFPQFQGCEAFVGLEDLKRYI